MPCYTIRATPITFENVAYKPGHLDVMIAALESMGYEIENKMIYKHGTDVELGKGLVLYPKGELASRTNKVIYRDGKFQIPSTMQERFTLRKVQVAYGMEAGKLHAKKMGWQFTQTGEETFKLVRR